MDFSLGEPEIIYTMGRGVARIFQRGGGGHTGSNNIVMAFSPRNIVVCFKKGLQRGNHGHPRTPPSYALDGSIISRTAKKKYFDFVTYLEAISNAVDNVTGLQHVPKMSRHD